MFGVGDGRGEDEARGVDGAADGFAAEIGGGLRIVFEEPENAGRDGLPVLTRIGESFPSRVAASLLRAIHLPELITTTPADYQQLAITLAHDAPRYQTLRTRLQHNLTTTPLFNSPLFTRDLESLYLTLRPTLDDRPARTAVTS